MDLIVDFYNSLDVLNLIIFWGIIVVIILLIIFSSIVINKNKVKSKHVITNIEDGSDEEDLPIKLSISEKINDDDNDMVVSENKNDVIEKKIDENSNFVAEELVINYNNNLVEKRIEDGNNLRDIEIPSKPYQRNVLREMSLSQTSPIGITKPVEKKNVELAKDLNDSLSNEKNLSIDMEIKKDMKKIDNLEIRKTDVCKVDESNKVIKKNDVKFNNLRDDTSEKKYYSQVSEILLNIPVVDVNMKKSSSEKYLEEVSKKLSEANVNEDIERTDYELEQEENAIISYKELMLKKDSIRTVDEEDAVISIEELMNRKKNNDDITADSKLYNITEEEENDEFLKELKQFRNDL